jgi:hypothetical protein
VGTPHYMSPEQREGHAADARADQFSFCLALHEALFGRACDGDPQESLLPMATGTEQAWWRRDRTVLRVIETTLARGMAHSPSSRFPTLASLLAVLRRQLRDDRRPRMVPIGGVVAGALVAALAVFLSTSRSATSPPRLVVTGVPADWSSLPVVTRVPGRVFCVEALDVDRLRLVWGQPRRAEDVDLKRQIRAPSALVPAAYAVGCPQRSPDGKQLIFEGHDADGRPTILHSSDPAGRNARPVVSSAEATVGSDPQWLSSSREFAFDLDDRTAAVFSLATNTIKSLRRSEYLSPGFVKIVDRGTDRIAVFHSEKGGMFSGELRLFEWPDVEVVAKRVDVTNLAMHRWRMAGNRAWGPIVEPNEADLVMAEADFESLRVERMGRIRGRDVLVVQPLGPGRAAVVTSSAQSEIHFLDRSGVERAVPGTFSWALDATADADGRIWFVHNRGTVEAVSVYDPRRDEIRQVWKEPSIFGVASLPDGRIVRSQGGEKQGLYLCDREGANCASFLEATTMTPPIVSPDGTQVAYGADSARGFSIYVASFAGGKPREVARGRYHCGIGWAGKSTLWVSDVKRGMPLWTEIDVRTSGLTGRTAPSVSGCMLGMTDPHPPFARSAWAVRKDDSDLRVWEVQDPALRGRVSRE